ncbi:MAG: hypothetical protein H0V09_03305, partial [Gemmatimonadetes bacterium]|nr:hypothetical protein [Gemmatimonadota bacterium]
TNGDYTVLITAAGAGMGRWKGIALTRWAPDPTVETLGTWLYAQDLDSGALWSVAARPLSTHATSEDVVFSPHAAEFVRRERGLAFRMGLTVAPDEDVEIRRLRVTNETGRPRRIALTSYGEVVLGPLAADRRHPAFNKLFVESEFAAERGALLFRRRPRAAHEDHVHLLHALVAPAGGDLQLQFETDRGRFLGRHRGPGAPAALAAPRGRLTGTAGATLDPIFALRCTLELAPHDEAELALLTTVGETRAEAIGRLDAFRSRARIEFSFLHARSHAEIELHELGIAAAQTRLLQELLSAVLHPFHGLRAASPLRAANTLSRRGLWAHGISGDVPILLVRIVGSEGLPMLRELLRAHAYWRRGRADVDLVILDETSSGYLQPVRESIQEAISEAGGEAWLKRKGGIFALATEGLAPADRALIESAASVVLEANGSPLGAQLERLRGAPPELPGFVPMPSAPPVEETTRQLQGAPDLLFDNGLGGFSADGREYVMHIEPGRATPAPWVNVIANPEFGCLVSESGAGYTWAAHSAENRLTPWRNDPVTDLPGEALYLRDEETAEIWSPTPSPAGGTGGGATDGGATGATGAGAAGGATSGPAYLVRHGAGYTVFEHDRHGLEQRLRLFVPPDAPVKIAHLRLTNHWSRGRRITATYYAEWVLGETREISAPHIVPGYEHASGALLATSAWSEHFGNRVAFLVASQSPHGVTGDRREFLGRAGDMRRPAALRRIGLSGRIEPGSDPCAAIQVHVDLAPGETREIHFALGQGRDHAQALELIARFRDAGAVEGAWAAVGAFWDDVLGAVTVRTPDPAMDLMLNRWLLYQTLSCRIWGRSALYQSSGAFGFRDQLQDTLGLLHSRPEWVRAHILESARHQFEEGDVLHWWHPPSDEGVRTRCSDDLVWLPFVTAAYVRATGDAAILDAEAPYLRGAPLAPEEEDRYTRFDTAPEGGTLHGHCVRALEWASATGAHGLPLIGTGDWNDGLSRVGIEGRGESVWLGWFLITALEDYAGLCDGRGGSESELAAGFRARAVELGRALEAHAWDGAWYRRAYFDDGSPLGSSTTREAQIDSISQSWAVLSGAADPRRASRAMQAVLVLLVRENPDLACLFWPPLDKTLRDPGYVKGYPPGVRENGGQYTHAAAWTGWAFARLGDGDRAFEIFRLLHPVHRTSTAAAAALYRVEPYVTAADIYTSPPHTGRGGWTWYTGSAGWTWRLGVEAILGLRREGHPRSGETPLAGSAATPLAGSAAAPPTGSGTGPGAGNGAALRIDPCIPRSWPRYDATYRFGGSTYRIRVENPHGVSRGVASATLDGKAVETRIGDSTTGNRDDPEGRPDPRESGVVVALLDDGQEHNVLVTMGGGD